MKNQIIRPKIIASLAIALAFSTGCSSAKESDLKVLMPGGETYALPVAGSSCASLLPGDLAKNSFAFSTMTLNWTNPTDNVYVIAIKLEFKSPNLSSGGYSCTLTGDELGKIFATGFTPWDGQLYQKPPNSAADAKLSITNSCKIKCGGVQWTDGIGDSTALGNVTVLAIQHSPTGEEKPVKGTAQVKLHFGGI